MPWTSFGECRSAILENLDTVQLVPVKGGRHEHPRAGVFAVDDRHWDVDRFTEIRLAYFILELAFLPGIHLCVESEGRRLLLTHRRLHESDVSHVSIVPRSGVGATNRAAIQEISRSLISIRTVRKW